MRPTHALLNDDGSYAAFVFPAGYDPSKLVELPAGYWDAHDLAIAKANKKIEVKAKREAVALLVSTAFGVAQADQRSKVNIGGLVQMAGLAKAAGAPFAVNFTMADNSRVPMDADEMIAFGIAVGQHNVAVHDFEQSLKTQIDAATTLADLDAIDVEGANWPS
jgi:hypothetical protein